MTLGNGLQITTSYDQNYRPVSMQAGTLIDRSYSYLANGLISSITDNPGQQ